jgi:pimeloyl-ACP methyl ester carboxylesterase
VLAALVAACAGTSQQGSEPARSAPSGAAPADAAADSSAAYDSRPAPAVGETTPPRPDTVLTVETPTGPVHAEAYGEGGPAVLVLHGFAARWRAEQWESLLRALPGHRVIGIDVPGHGRSAKPHDAGAYGELLVDDIARVLDALGENRVHLIGYSMGGIIALKTAAALPERVASLTLIGQGWLSEQELAEMAEAAGTLLDVDTAALSEPEREGFRRNDVQALAALGASYPALRVSGAELSSLPAPILIVIGSEDERVARARALLERRPDARLEILDGRTHGTVAADPEYATLIAAFLREVESGGG